jgi:hypothetical protein
MISNLGVTFEPAIRGKFRVWSTVSGELEIPESQRWVLRAPVRARLVHVEPRGAEVSAGQTIARMTSPDIKVIQRELVNADRTLTRLKQNLQLLNERTKDSDAFIKEAQEFGQASKKRLGDLERLEQGGNSLIVKDLIEARKSVTEASQSILSALRDRDDVTSQILAIEQEIAKTESEMEGSIESLSHLTGRSRSDLSHAPDEIPAWKGLLDLEIRAPNAGIVLSVAGTAGEMLDESSEILTIVDALKLRFRGYVPEAELRLATPGTTVRLEFPSPDLPTIETTLTRAPPLADRHTRMVPLEAMVINESLRMSEGLSVIAHVLAKESKHEEVLIPFRCVAFDGLEAIVFKRDPSDASKVIRTPVTLGARDSNLAEVISGVLQGEMLVADGLQQVKQAGANKPTSTGHFHADGTFHEGEK